MKPTDQPEARTGLRRQRRMRWAFRLNMAAALLLAAAAAGMLHYLASRHYTRWDWSRTDYYSLSDKSRTLLAQLTSNVQAVVFFRPSHELYTDIENLLREYQYASPRVRVIRVDPDRDPVRAQELMERFKVDQANVVVFACGERSKFVRAEEIAEYDFEPVRQGRPPVMKAFRGEEAFSSAIHNITTGDVPLICFLGGHGERSPENFDRGNGYGELTRLIQRDNVAVRQLLLGEERDIPAACRALIVAGPRRRLAPPEIDRIAAYLRQNGRAIFLLDSGADTGLNPLLAEWGVRVGDDRVVDGTRTWTGRELFVSQYGEHPVTAPMNGISAVFDRPRSIEPIPPREGEPLRADRPRAVALAFCSPQGWAETEPDQNPMRFDPARDRPGPVAVATAVEKGPIPGIEVQITPTRFVVFGDASFVANGSIISGNGDFFMNALNWVLDREERMGIAPRPVQETRLDLGPRQLLWLGLLVIGALPGAVALVGLVVWAGRRK